LEFTVNPLGTRQEVHKNNTFLILKNVPMILPADSALSHFCFLGDKASFHLLPLGFRFKMMAPGFNLHDIAVPAKCDFLIGWLGAV
jgi:hypothetical protein